MFGQDLGDTAIAYMEQLGEVAVGEQSTLLVSLLTQAKRLAQQPLGGRKALDAQSHVLRGGEVEEDGDKIGIRDALALAGRVVDTDGHPECLSMCNVVLGAHVLEYDF